MELFCIGSASSKGTPVPSQIPLTAPQQARRVCIIKTSFDGWCEKNSQLLTFNSCAFQLQGIVVLALTRSTTPADLLIGSTFNLTVTVNNIGLQDAANVTVSQVLPQGMSLKGTAPAGELNCQLIYLSVIYHCSFTIIMQLA